MFLFLLGRGVNVAAGGLYDYVLVHFIAGCNRVALVLAPLMPKSS